MRSLHVPAVCILAFMAACSGGDHDAFVGKWRRADNREVLEFAADGTLTRVTSLPSRAGSDNRVTWGGSYRLPQPGEIQLTREPDGPVQMSYAMLGDSVYLVGLDGQRIKYYRDTGEKPAVSYHLRTVDGHGVPHVHPQEVHTPTGSTFTEKVAFKGGTLTLDPLTHTFTQALQVELPGWTSNSPETEYRYGSYTLVGDSLTLHYTSDPESPSLSGRLLGDELTHGTFYNSPFEKAPQKYLPGPVLGYVRG